MYLLSVIGLSILCFSGSIMSNPVESVDKNERAVEMISTAAAQFSTELMKTIAEDHKENLILSPVSVDMVLAMASYGADGNTAVQMKNVLHLPNEEVSSERGYQNLVDQFNNVKEVELHLANKMFVNQSFPVKESYQKFTEEYFRSTTQQANFQDAPEAAQSINSFCKEHTNNKITEIVEAKDVDPSTAMFLVNAAYFKGVWDEKFDPQATHEMPFHVDENTVKNVSMMYKNAQFNNYGESQELEATFIEIPYKGKELSMAIFLPNANSGLEQLLEKLSKTNIGEVLKNGSREDVMLHLPKFKIESTIQLSEPLKKIGLGELFSHSANFRKISDIPVKVSKVVQKAFIEVNEEGSEAAAATGMGVVFLSFPLPPVLMQVDRPFVYTIIHKPSNVPIFMGYVKLPSI